MGSCKQAGIHRSDFLMKKYYATDGKYEIKKAFKLYKLEDGPKTKVNITRDEALKYYSQMVSIRKLEYKCTSLYKEREIRGFCHLYSGQEACGVGVKAVMDDKDTIVVPYRCHGWAYLQEVPIYRIIAELMGRITGCGRGKGGSVHLYAKNMFGGNGIVGASVPLGVGSGFVHKYNNTKGVCLTLYGDGAANQGQVHESYNLAKLYNLPIIFICENNKYGMGTADFRASATVDYFTRGCYLPGVWADGMDVLAVREATRYAKEHVLANRGPILLELETYRFYGHSMSDPGISYRTREDVQKMRQIRDPIVNFKRDIIQLQLLTKEETKNIDKEIDGIVEDATKKAKRDSHPPIEELAGDVYLKPVHKNIRGISSFIGHQHKTFGKLMSLS